MGTKRRNPPNACHLDWRLVSPFAKSSPMDLYVGASSERGSIKKFDLDLLEMPVTDSMPKSKTLREMRTTRPDLKFSLRLHPDVAQLGAKHADVARARDAAEALGASVVVVPTGPRFTPTNGTNSNSERSLKACGLKVFTWRGNRVVFGRPKNLSNWRRCTECSS